MLSRIFDSRNLSRHNKASISSAIDLVKMFPLDLNNLLIFCLWSPANANNRAGCSSNLLMINTFQFSSPTFRRCPETLLEKLSILVDLENCFWGLQNVFVMFKCVSVVLTFLEQLKRFRKLPIPFLSPPYRLFFVDAVINFICVNCFRQNKEINFIKFFFI